MRPCDIHASTNILTIAELRSYYKVDFLAVFYLVASAHPASVSVANLIYDSQPGQHPEKEQQQNRMINDFSLKIHKHKSSGLPTRQM